MSALPIEEQVRWQDLQVMSEMDIVLEIAKKKGWEDCEVFGYGDMITEPQEAKGWKLIPADRYTDSIPLEAVGRLHQVINAGVRVRGVIIADDERRQEPVPEVARLDTPPTAPPPAPARPAAPKPVSLSAPAPARFETSQSGVGSDLSIIGKVLFGLFCVAGAIALGAGAAALVGLIARTLAHFWPVVLVGLFILMVTGSGTDYDPKMVVLVDDGKGGTAWISLFTWYD